MALAPLPVREHFARTAFLRALESREIALERHLAGVIAHVGQQAAAHYHATHSDAHALPIEQRIARVLTPSIRETARSFGQQVGAKSAWLGLETKIFEGLDADTEAFIAQYTAEHVTQISDSLRAQIVEIIRRGLTDGLSTEEVAQAIVDATSGEMAMARARRIARTETHTASMVGQYGAARASPLAYQKRWLATEDARTRESHAEANGQVRDIDEPFEVGDAQLMFPGDPSGPPEEIINCRCVLLLEPIPLQGQEPRPDTGEEPSPAVDQPDDQLPAEDISPLPVPAPGEPPPELPATPDQEQPEELDAGDLLADVDIWRTFYDRMRAKFTLPADVTLYAVGAECGLPQFGSEADLFDEWIGQEIVVPRFASMNPIRIGGDFIGLQDTFPLYGRPVVVEIKAPAGTPIAGGLEIAMGVQLADSVKIVVTAIREETWGETQDEAGVPRDTAPQRYRYRRLPPGRGVTIVEAEVQS